MGHRHLSFQRRSSIFLERGPSYFFLLPATCPNAFSSVARLASAALRPSLSPEAGPVGLRALASYRQLSIRWVCHLPSPTDSSRLP